MFRRKRSVVQKKERGKGVRRRHRSPRTHNPHARTMLSVLSLVALGLLEQCMYVDTDPSTVEDCSGNVNAAQCVAVPDDTIGTCNAGTDGGFTKGTCSGSTIKMQFHAKADCSDDTSAKCVIDILDPTNAVTTGCHMTFTIDECGTYFSALGQGIHIKYTGSCPAAQTTSPASRARRRRAASSTPPSRPPPPTAPALTSRRPRWPSGSR